MPPETMPADPIDMTPTPEGYAQIAHRFAQNILGDVRKARAADDRALMVEAIKIAAHLRAIGRDDLFAGLLVAIRDDAPIRFSTESEPDDTEPRDKGEHYVD